jgi:2'-5' RNA ligase
MATDGKMKLFVALDLPEVNDQGSPIQYENVQLLIKNSFPDFRPAPSLHVTLVFIGTVSSESLPVIEGAVDDAMRQFVAIEKRGLSSGISGLMIEPGASVMGKNAVAMKLVDNQLLIRLVLYVQKALKLNKILFDETHKDIIAHVTLGRIAPEKINELQLHRLLKQLQAPIGSRQQSKESFTARTITLFQSMPASQYSPIRHYEI